MLSLEEYRKCAKLCDEAIDVLAARELQEMLLDWAVICGVSCVKCRQQVQVEIDEQWHYDKIVCGCTKWPTFEYDVKFQQLG